MEKSINNKVKIHEITRITPFFSSTAEFSFPLTLFDTYWFKFHPIERLFFCQVTDLTADFFHSIIFPKLKHFLSITLLHCLPLADSLMWPLDAAKPAIYYFPKTVFQSLLLSLTPTSIISVEMQFMKLLNFFL